VGCPRRCGRVTLSSERTAGVCADAQEPAGRNEAAIPVQFGTPRPFAGTGGDFVRRRRALQIAGLSSMGWPGRRCRLTASLAVSFGCRSVRSGRAERSTHWTRPAKHHQRASEGRLRGARAAVCSKGLYREPDHGLRGLREWKVVHHIGERRLHGRLSESLIRFPCVPKQFAAPREPARSAVHCFTRAAAIGIAFENPSWSCPTMMNTVATRGASLGLQVEQAR
jgi:hypothetical protein